MPASKNKPKTPALIWTQLKGLYGSGLFESVDALHKHCSRIFKICPSLSKLKQRCARDHWSKTTYQERIAAAQEKSFQEMFEEAGLGKKETVLLIRDGILHAEAVIDRLIKSLQREQVVDEKGNIKAAIGLTPESESLLKEYVTSLKVRNIYLRERNKLTGDYAAVKIRDQGRGGAAAGSDDEMSLDELLAERARMKELLDVEDVKNVNG